LSDLIIIYIAAAIVVGLLIAFVALSVRLLAQRVSKSIRTKATELLSTYDELLEKKSLELKKMNSAVARKREELYRIQESAVNKNEAVEESASDISESAIILNVAEKMGNASYHDGRVGSVYQKIRTMFSHDPLDAIRELVPDVGEKGPATMLLEQISYETVYSLSTLSGEEQVQILAETLDRDGLRLLEEFAAQHSEFQAIRFYDFLKGRALSEPQPVVLRMPATANVGWLPSGVNVQIDNDICEGFVLEANNQLYDYCVRKSEIS